MFETSFRTFEYLAHDETGDQSANAAKEVTQRKERRKPSARHDAPDHVEERQPRKAARKRRDRREQNQCRQHDVCLIRHDKHCGRQERPTGAAYYRAALIVLELVPLALHVVDQQQLGQRPTPHLHGGQDANEHVGLRKLAHVPRQHHGCTRKGHTGAVADAIEDAKDEVPAARQEMVYLRRLRG